MRMLKYFSLLVAVVCMGLAITARLFLPGKILFGLAALSYLRLTMIMLLFALTFHFLFSER